MTSPSVQAVVRFMLAGGSGYLLGGWRGAAVGVMILGCVTSLLTSIAVELLRRRP